MKKILLLFAAMCCMMVANAENSEATKIGNIFYILDGNSRTATVTWGGNDESSGTPEYTGSVTIPAKVTYNDVEYAVTSIGSRAFSMCLDLKSVTIPNGVINIEMYAFAVSGLTSINIPASVVNIGMGAFQTIANAESIVVEAGNPVYDSRENCNALIETSTSTLLTGCKNTVIPQGVASIGMSAFSLCQKLTSITIPSSVKSIGQGAFVYCTGLTSITVLAPTAPALGKDAFYLHDGYITEIAVYVTNISSYNKFSQWGGIFTNISEISWDDSKKLVLDEIAAELGDIELSDEEQAQYDNCLSIIKETEQTGNSDAAILIDDIKAQALAIVRVAKVRIAKESAIAAIETAIQGETSAGIANLAQSKKTLIGSLDDVNAINNAKAAALELISTYKAGKGDAFGSLGEQQNGPAIEVIKDGERIILYRPDRVNFIRANN